MGDEIIIAGLKLMREGLVVLKFIHGNILVGHDFVRR